MKLFTLGEDYLIELNKEWISSVEEFRYLLKRDKDRFKKHVMKEFLYIYHYVDYKSQFVHFAEKDREEEALKNAGLTRSDIDEHLVAAVSKYKSLQETRSMRLINGGFKAIDKVNDFFDALIIADPDDAKKVMEAVGKIGSAIANLKELENQVKREMAEDAGIRGDKEKGLREDANPKETNMFN